MKINVGKTPENKLVKLDVAKLISTRLLITANSGGGKSWLLRLLAEALSGLVQVIILDPEGEFVTLREVTDFMLVGDGGEWPTELSSAKMLARKLMEFKASAIIDLYDLKLADRREYVNVFLSSLMNLPKKFWTPVVVIIDEAHIFCPQKGKSPSREAVITLMTQGRKRGYAGFLATQRISKIDNDAASEGKNRMFGNIVQDNDQIRAGDELGINKAQRIKLRDLDPGEFLCYGPAFSTKGIVTLKAGKVKSTHPEAGKRHLLEVPPASAVISKLVEQMGDVPELAQAEVEEIERLQSTVATLNRELKVAKAKKPGPEKVTMTKTEYIEVPVVDEDFMKKLRAHVALLSGVPAMLEDAKNSLSKVEGDFMTTLNNVKPSKPYRVPAKQNDAPDLTPAKTRPPIVSSEGDKSLSKGQRKVLTALAQNWPDWITKNHLGILTGYSVKGGTFANYIGQCNTSGWLERNGADYRITDAGLQALGPYAPLPTGEELQRYWLGKLGKGPTKILEVLCANYPNSLGRDVVADLTNYTASGGTFANYLGELRTRKLITGSDPLRAADILFD